MIGVWLLACLRQTALRASKSDDLLKQAEALRREAAEEERSLFPTPTVAKRLRMVLPMSKPDWTVVEEEVEFEPMVDGRLLRFDVTVPCGLLLEEDERGFVVVAEVADASNACNAGVREGDVLRATSAVRMQMEMPTWQLLGGGIGRPKFFRFILGCDRPTTFDEVLNAIASNRDDPQNRPALLVIERPYSS